MKELIGGHQERPENAVPGMHVFRTDKGIQKEAYNANDGEGLVREAECLRKLSGSGFAPELIETGGRAIIEEDVGQGEPIQDGEVWRRNCTRLLHVLRKAEIRHGDLTWSNIIVRNDSPVAIDFQQSLYFSEIPDPKDKRTLADSYYLWRAVQQPAKEHPIPDTPRVMRRWLTVLGSLGGFALGSPLKDKTFLDLGCFQGDFVAMAAAEGMIAVGLDTGKFSAGNSISEARKQWTDIGCTFQESDIMAGHLQFQFETVMMFSTWPYIVQDYGREAALDLLERITQDCGILFFETQLKGDGPGPDFLVEDQDVGNMLGAFGVPQKLETIPVTGREASRTVWRVDPHG